jgi:peptidoglycan/LPS O-acetylase OafA/YrhL
VAALVVVIHHGLLTFPTLAEVQATGSAAGRSLGTWLFTHTPLHLVWAGEEAVLVFFVLSGLVLALPATRRAIDWRTYYPRRVVRLYLPVWGSLVLAVVLVALVPRGVSPQRSPWLNAHVGIPVSEVWHDAFLLDSAGYLNSPLWSLRWEVVLSLLLPVYLVFGQRARGLVAVKVLLLLGLIGAGTVLGSHPLRYLPVFGIGVLMAFHAEELSALGQWMSCHRRHRVLWGTTGAMTGLLLTARWVVNGIPAQVPLLDAVASGSAIVGAALVVVLAQHWPRARASMETRPAQWLGARSFSLYLVHEPVIVTVAFLLPATTTPWAILAVGPIVALGVTTAFYRFVEAPAHRLAKAAGGRSRRRPAPPAGPTPREVP